ncbi:hypothetical protein MiYa_02850 [Microcystis aeruginosa NIES-2519]|uniref:PEP-CTERM protein-sorting domain-containing protein n=1 Tax=Microcystis aeruginosa NIES-2519 TaxID=2303981 RepID=A0A5A5RDT8_MICAE|nr:hypothetical protein [Microcystis aeruginosa]GCA71311.1 hypothetical protein MiYa_02850 [Microcystis aeruginosa NIES-2519]
MNFNKIILVTGLAVSGIALSGVFAPAHAAFFQNTFGLSDSHSTITFGSQDYTLHGYNLHFLLKDNNIV